MTSGKKKVLLMTDWFEPGFKAGGPIRSCVNFAQHLKNDLDIHVLTTDRDLGDTQPYENIIADKWIDYDSLIKACYISPAQLSFRTIARYVAAVQPDIIYLNSMFSKNFTIYPLWLKKRGRTDAKMILSPRGMLRESALQYKSQKKNLFLALLRMTGLHKKIHFSCTDETEINDVHRCFGNVETTLLPNLPGFQQPLVLPEGKQSGYVKMIFVGRIHPVKNLDFLLTALKSVQQNIQLTIVASIEEKDYWQQCNDLVKTLPGNIEVTYSGELPNNAIRKTLLQHHFFVLPTRGENFGHAIFESLAAGRPVLISDQTPWRNLAESKAGWDVPLQQQLFASAIDAVAAMNQETLNDWCKGAWELANNFIHRPGIQQQYLKLFK